MPTVPSAQQTPTILYVGGSGPDNYTTIQAAIDAATPGDTVYIYDDHAPYYEHPIVTIPLTLRGEAKATTIIDGNGTGDVITIHATTCTITGLTVQHSGPAPMLNADIYLQTANSCVYNTIVRDAGAYAVGIFFNNSQNCTAHNNTIYDNGNEGIYLRNSSAILIRDNLITHNGHCSVVISMSTLTHVTHNTFTKNHDAGVSIWPNSTNNEVDSNTITDCPYSGVGLWTHANNNSIHDNHFINNSQYGIVLTHADGTVITRNEINGSNPGIILRYSNSTVITANNFLHNQVDAWFENSSKNHWQGNYWARHPFGLPVLIHGTRLFPRWKPTPVRWINLDWHPAKQLFDLG